METRLYHLHALTALHVGIGQGSGIVDLPIAREKATHLPMVPGSALKGVLRTELRESLNHDQWTALFGPERIADGDSAHAGALAVGDARLLCLPVRSLVGTFAWATCPLVLRRYARDCAEANTKTPEKIPSVAADKVLTDKNSVIAEANRVLLEDLDLNQGDGAGEWANFIAEQIFKGNDSWTTLFRERFAILPDGVFDFLSETATEIRTRVRINEKTRTVEKGGLWYEENLPAESLLWGLVAADRSFSAKIAETAKQLIVHLPPATALQIGGKATIGRGRVRWLRG